MIKKILRPAIAKLCQLNHRSPGTMLTTLLSFFLEINEMMTL